ncbi:MAG: HD domain-containing phosphohydrolase [Pseudomonadota bacterium]
MARIKLVEADTKNIKVGSGLPWMLYDAENGGTALFKQGEEVTYAMLGRIVALVRKGVYRDFVDAPATADAQTTPAHKGEVEVAPPVRRPRNLKIGFFETVTHLHTELASVFEDIERGIRNKISHRVYELAQQVQDICWVNPDAALGVVHMDKRGNYTVRHPLHSAILCELASRTFTMDEDDRLSMVCAVLTSNIGMRQLQEQLHAQKEPLSDEQRAAVRSHPERSIELLRAVGVKDEKWLETILQHHEEHDGNGYPRGLDETQLSRESMLVSMTDRYHAMISARDYRQAMSPIESLRSLYLSLKDSKKALLAQAFIKMLGLHPPGMCVRLFNGDVGIVVRRGVKGGAPRVMSFISPRGGPYEKPVIRDTQHAEFKIKELGSIDLIERPVSAEQLWG